MENLEYSLFDYIQYDYSLDAEFIGVGMVVGSVAADGQFPMILDFWLSDFVRYQCLKLRNSCQ